MNISIQKFQELYKVSILEMDELEKSSLLVQCFTGKSMNDINSLTLKKYNAICKKINESLEYFNKDLIEGKPKNIVKANGNWYFINYDITKFPNNAGTYVELVTFGKDVIGNLHKIMASMVTPMKWTWKGLAIDTRKKDHKKIAEDMLHMDFKNAYHSCVFFYAILMKSIQNSSNYLSKAMNQNQIQQFHKNFQEVSDGYIIARWYQNLKI